MENLYNTIFIVDISQNPDEAETLTSRIQQLIEDHGGIIKKINRWGKRRMAFSIESKSHGFYVEIEYSANSRLNIPKILEGEFRLSDRVFRYMTYIVSNKELIQREKNAGKIKRRQAEEAEAKQSVPAQDKKVTVEAEKEIRTMEEKVEIEPVKEEEPAEIEPVKEKEQAETESPQQEKEKEVPLESAPAEESEEEKSLQETGEEKKQENQAEKAVPDEQESSEKASREAPEETEETEEKEPR